MSIIESATIHVHMSKESISLIFCFISVEFYSA